MATGTHKPKPRNSIRKKTAKRAKAADKMSAATRRTLIEEANAHLQRAWKIIYESHHKSRKRTKTSRNAKNHL